MCLKKTKKKTLHKIGAALCSLLLLTSCGAGRGGAEPVRLTAVGVHRQMNVVPEETECETEAPEVIPMPQVICIDPGHGFDDAGASSEFLGEVHEGDVNLAIALMLDEELRALGYSTILTHDGESFPITSAYDNNNKYRPEERTAYAATLDIDYYVSIHCNSYTDPSVGGVRIYYYDGAVKTEHTSETIAQCIGDRILQTLESGGTCTLENMKKGVFHVLRETTVPASLIEVGFVTNEADAANMLNPEWQRNMALGIAKGIDAFYRPSEN